MSDEKQASEIMAASEPAPAVVQEPTDVQIHNAAHKWCGQKDRETFYSDIVYFKNNWSALPGLRKYVEAEMAVSGPAVVQEPMSGLSVGGVNVFGSKESLDAVKQWQDDALALPVVRARLNALAAPVPQQEPVTWPPAKGSTIHLTGKVIAYSSARPVPWVTIRFEDGSLFTATPETLFAPVPKQEPKCPDCEGTGSESNPGLPYGEAECSSCDGSGQPTPVGWVRADLEKIRDGILGGDEAGETLQMIYGMLDRLAVPQQEPSEVERLRSQLVRITEHYDVRSEMYTNDADLARNMCGIARAALRSATGGENDR